MKRSLIALVICAACSSSDGGAPAAPSGLTVTATANGVHLAWQDNSTNEAHFMVERKNGAAFQTLATVPANVVEYDDTSVLAATTYAYRITAMAESGQTSSSAEASVTATAAPDMAVGPDLAKPSAGSSTCHAAGCRAVASNCSTGCSCVAVIADNPDPACAGTVMTCAPDPCAGKVASCNHGTGKCELN